MRQDVRTSDHWRVVRNFVQQVRRDAHELNVERSVMQEILGLCDELGTEYVMDMIQHEKRVMDNGSWGEFWAAKDRQDEADYERAEGQPRSKQTQTANIEGGQHGI